MPRIPQIDRWNEDPEYNALPPAEKQAILENYFDDNISDEEFQGLPDIEKSEIKNNFVSYHMPEQLPQEPEQTSGIGRQIYEGAKGVAKATGIGAVQGLTTELPSMVGQAAQFAGGELGRAAQFTEEQFKKYESMETKAPGTRRFGDLGPEATRAYIDIYKNVSNIIGETGKNIKEWAEAHKLFKEYKPERKAEEIAYQGALMLAPSVVPGMVVNKGIRVLSGVGKLVKGAKAAQAAGRVTEAAQLFEKANQLAFFANEVGSVATAGMFGLSQAQQTRDTAEEQAKRLEDQGKFDEAREVREQAEGFAPYATGAIEAGGEYLGTKYLGKLMGLDESDIVKRGAKNVVKQFLKETLGVEVGTEIGQQFGQSLIEKQTGIRPDADPIAESLDVIGPTIFMTLLTGGMAGALGKISREPTDTIDILKDEEEDIFGEGEKAKPKPKAAVDIDIIKKNLKAFREEVTGPPFTAEVSAETFFGPQAVQEEIDRGTLTGLGLPVPTEKSAEESARAIEEQLPPMTEAQKAYEADAALLGERPFIPPLPRQEYLVEEEIPTETPVPPHVTETVPVEEAPEEQVSIPPERLAEKEKPTITKEEVDIKAQEAATSPLTPIPQPTEAQKEAGNYKKGHVNIQGLDISIENPKGSIRTGTDSDGETWETEMKSHYGYIKGTVGKDKDHLDVFVGDNPENKDVYVIDQVDPKTGEFDEHKVMMGFKNTRLARKGYKENYEEGWKGLGAITKMTMDEFKAWSSDKDKTKLPLSYKEEKRAKTIREDEERVPPGEGRPLEPKAPAPTDVEGEKKRVVAEREEEGGPDIQQQPPAREEAGGEGELKKTKKFNPETDSLSSWVRKQGGFSTKGEFRGELLHALSIKESGAGNLLNNKTGLFPDQMRERAVEIGWIDEDVSTSDFIDMVSKDIFESSKRGNAGKRLFHPSKVEYEIEEQVEENIENVPAGDLKVGDTFNIRGEKHKVIEEDKDGNLIIKNSVEIKVDPFDVLPIDNGEEGIKSTKKEKPVTEEKPPPQPETAKEPSDSRVIAERIARRLEEPGAIISSRELFKTANEVFGGTQAQNKYTPKDAYDAMELAVNLLIDRRRDNTISVSARKAKGIASFLREMINRLPTQTRRTQETQEFQQFSTPPHLAYLANWVGNIQKGETYLEPSAGIGGLAVFGKNAGAKVIVNELSDRRRELLGELEFDQVLKENAEQINNILPKSIKPTVVVMNPPFSATAGRVTRTSSKEGFKHVEQALRRLEPNGRLVAILGKGVTDTNQFRSWWRKNQNLGTIRADIGIPGSEYRKYGTTYGNQLLVIDKVADTGQQKVTGEVANIEEAFDLLEGVRNERITREPAPAQPEVERVPGTTEGAGRPTGVALPTTGIVGGGERKPGSTVSGRGDVERQPIRQPGRPDELTGEGKPGIGESGRRGGLAGGGEQPGRPGVERPGQATGVVESGAKLETPTRQKRVKKEFSKSIYEEYEPKVKISGSKKHPGKLVESAAMNSVESPKATYTPNLPKETITKGLLSESQLESIVYAGQAHSRILPSGERAGFFIGDGTGVGKGREIAGIIFDNWRQGRRRAVWISQNSDLADDAGRDIEGVGFDKNLIIDFKKHVKGYGEITQNEGIAFLGYSLLKSKSQKDKTLTRLKQLTDWLGSDFDGVIVFDESHNLGNAISVKGKRGNTKPSEQALIGVELQRLLPLARIVYVSATGATEVMNLAYADRLGLWGEGTPFANKKDFIEKISAGGLSAMELVTRDMKAGGMYIARSLSYDGVKYGKTQHDLTPEQRKIYDQYSEGWQIVLNDVESALDITGASGKGLSAARAQFWGSLQRFFNQVITSMQTPSVIKSIEEDIKNGHSAVIQLVNTNEATQAKALSKLEEEDSLEDLDLTPKELLMSYVENSFPVAQYEEYTDEDGNKKKRIVTDSQGNPVENTQAVELRENLLDRLGSIKGVDNPLDMIIRHFGVDNVAEITGRTERIVYKNGKLVREKRSKAKRMTDTDLFMNDKKKILIFSDAGGTGRSYHASLDVKNQRLRRHYLLQAGWRADRAIQGFGRTHRSNQAQTPEYILVTTNIPGQKRFISSIARRLDQLGALTKGQRETGSGGFFDARDNLESEYAQDAVGGLIRDIYRRNVPNIDFNTFVKESGLNKLVDEYGNLNQSTIIPVTTFLNRILAMSIESQNTIFDEFGKRIDANVRRAMEAGTLDVGMETLRGNKIKKVDEQVVHTDERTGAKTNYVALDVTKDNRNLLKFEDIKAPGKKYGFFVNNKSGKVWAAGGQYSRTNTSTGTIEDVHDLIGSNRSSKTVLSSELDNAEQYRKVSEDGAKTIWDQEYEKLPKEVTYREHMITGTILPIWDRLPTDTTRIMRAQTDEGDRMIGRIINQKELNNTLRRLGAQASQEKLSPSDLFHRIRDNDFKASLSNGWKIKRSKVSGEWRIELVGPDYRYLNELKNNGAFVERVNSVTRFFVPTSDDGVDVIQRITRNRPVVELETPTNVREDLGEGTEQYSLQLPMPRDVFRESLISRQMTEAMIRDVFPGQSITETDEGFIVKFKNGAEVTIQKVGYIPSKPSQLAAWGKKELGEGEVIAGVFVRGKDGKMSQIKITGEADNYTLHHESMHLLEDFGIITKQESGRINREIRKSKRWDNTITGAENRANWLADEMTKPLPKGKLGTILQKIKDFVHRLVNRFGVSTIGGLKQEIKTGKIFEREVTAKEKENVERYMVKRKDKPTEESEEQPGMLRKEFDELVYWMQDKFNYLNKAQMESERRNRAELPEEQNAYMAETRYHGMAEAQLEDFEEEYIDPLLDVLSKNDIDVGNFGIYLHARHAKEANAHLMEINPERGDNEALSGMTDEYADEILNKVENSDLAGAYKEAGSLFDRITKKQRDVLVESGQESQETINEWENTYDFYAPLMREGKGIGKMPVKGRGFDVRGKQKIRAGSTREVVHIVAHAAANTEAAIIRAEKLKVSRAFLKFAQNNPGPWKIDTIEYAPRFNDEGLIEYKPDPTFRFKDNVMIVREGGINHRIIFDENNLNAMRIVQSLKNLHAKDNIRLLNTLGKINRYLSVVNTSLNPEFIISNFFRDLQTAGYNMSDSQADKIRMKALKEIPKAWKGIRQFHKGDKGTEWAEWYNRFRHAGGKTGWIEAHPDIESREKKLIKKINDMKPGKSNTLKKGLKAVGNFIELENTAVENAVRLSVFKNLIDNGVSEGKAAVIAKELTVNFNKKGAAGPVMNSAYLFYNASVQGSTRLIKAAATSPKVRKMMVATTVFATALDIINRIVGGKDDDGEDRYDKIAPWIKEKNMIIMLPSGTGYIQLPLAWGYNIFHVMGQVTGEAISKKGFEPWDGATRVAGAVISAFNPVGGEASVLQVISPTIFDPIVQWATNEDWTGRKIRPDYNPFATKPESQRYWGSVSAPSKYITEKINELTGGDVIKPGKIDISPEAIDLAIGTYTGSFGKFIKNFVSTPIKAVKGENIETYEIPFLRRVYGKLGQQSITQDFYENMDAVRLVKRQLLHYKDDSAKLREIRKENPTELKVLKFLNKKRFSISKISKEISDLRKKQEQAEKIKNPKRRDAIIKASEERIEKIMKAFNKRFQTFKEKE